MIVTARIDRVSYRKLKERLIIEGIHVSLDTLQSFCAVRERRGKTGKYLQKYLTMQKPHEQNEGKQPLNTKNTSKKKETWKFDLDEISRGDAG